MTDPASAQLASAQLASAQLAPAQPAGVAADAAAPHALFCDWLAQARQSEPHDWNAAALGTCDEAGWPDVRIVLIKAHGPEGLAFFTNYGSEKARALAHRPRASLCFHWGSLGRQVRVRGAVTILPAHASDAYFATRDRASQLGAWASDQSRLCAGSDTLRARYDEQAARFDGLEVPRPPHWGGYRLVPERWEFWKSGTSRLHDRHVYTHGARGWTVAQLFP